MIINSGFLNFQTADHDMVIEGVVQGWSLLVETQKSSDGYQKAVI